MILVDALAKTLSKVLICRHQRIAITWQDCRGDQYAELLYGLTVTRVLLSVACERVSIQYAGSRQLIFAIN